MAFEAFAVAVKLQLVGNLSAGLLGISKNLQNAHMDAEKLKSSLTSIGKQLAVGGIMFAGGVALGSMFKAPYEEAKKLAQAQADFATLNLTAAQNQRVYAAAASNSHKILGSTITDNIKLIQDLHTATGNLEHSIADSTMFSEFATAVKFKNGGKNVDGLVNFAAKSLEHRGDKVMSNRAAFDDELSRMSKVYFGSNGRVSPADYFHFSQTGKMAYTMADADFLYGPMAAMINAKTGETAGTAQMTTMSSLIGGHMTKKAIGFMRGLGLWEDQESPLTKKFKNNINTDPAVQAIIAANGDKLIQSGGMPSWAATTAMANTDKFTREILVPRIRKKYGNLSDEQIGLLLTQQFNRNTADDLSFWVLNQNKTAKDSAIFKKSMGFHQAYQNYLKSPEGAEAAAGAAWDNFLAITGSVYLPVATKALQKFAEWMDVAGQWAEKNQGMVKVFTGALAGLAVFLVSGGLINMTMAAARGFGLLFDVLGGAKVVKFASSAVKLGFNLITSGAKILFNILIWGGRMLLMTPIGLTITAIAGIAYLLWRNWDTVKPKLLAIWDWSTNAVSNLWTSIKNGFNTFVSWFLHGWQNLFNNLIDGMNGILPASMAVGKMSFADVYDKSVAPVPNSGKTTTHVTYVLLDGKKVAESVTSYQERAASRPLSASSAFDPSRAQPFPGLKSLQWAP
jgi:hypothetical protein